MSDRAVSVSVPGAIPIRVAIPDPCTVGQIRQAESQLSPEISSYLACTEDGSDLPDEHPVHPGGDIFFLHPVGDDDGVLQAGDDDEPMSDDNPDVSSATHAPSTEHTAHAAAPASSHDRTASSPLGSDPLLGIRGRSFLRIACPEIPDVTTFTSLRSKQMPAEIRKQVLSAQNNAWADDQVHQALCGIAACAPAEQAVRVFDPLMMTSCVLACNDDLVQ